MTPDIAIVYRLSRVSSHKNHCPRVTESTSEHVPHLIRYSYLLMQCSQQKFSILLLSQNSLQSLFGFLGHTSTATQLEFVTLGHDLEFVLDARTRGLYSARLFTFSLHTMVVLLVSGAYVGSMCNRFTLLFTRLESNLYVHFSCRSSFQHSHCKCRTRHHFYRNVSSNQK